MLNATFLSDFQTLWLWGTIPTFASARRFSATLLPPAQKNAPNSHSRPNLPPWNQFSCKWKIISSWRFIIRILAWILNHLGKEDFDPQNCSIFSLVSKYGLTSKEGATFRLKFSILQKSQCLKITKNCLILQHCERSELRLHFEWTKGNQKGQKMSILASFW